MLTDRSTLPQFLIEACGDRTAASSDLNAAILNVAVACKAIARRVAYGALGGFLGEDGGVNVHGEAQKKLDVVANRIFVRCNEWAGVLAGMASKEMELPYEIPARHPKGPYLLVFDPLDGSSNIDADVSVGSIFSILRAPESRTELRAADFLQPGVRQVCAGYAIYGPTTMLVLSVGNGVYGFTLEPQLGEFILTHPSIAIPPATREFAINTSNSRFWTPAVKRYVDECIAGSSGPRGKDFTMRWIASLVAELHRILIRGGVFLYPRDSRDAGRRGKLRLLYEVNPVAFLVEQAGGRASTGSARALDVVPSELHERSGFVFGSLEEVDRIEAYHRGQEALDYDSPLFGARGLFRTPG